VRPPLQPRTRRYAALIAIALAAVASAALAQPASAAPDDPRLLTKREQAPAPAVRTWTIHYRSHNGVRRAATVLLPSWYGPRRNPPLPLVISPHGRGLSGAANAKIWGNLPARGPFAVVNPDGHGRVLDRYSWGYSGQIDDLARMPRIVMQALPWLRLELSSVYAFGGSMGGQETLLLLARYPGLLAGAAAFDPVTDFARQYNAFSRLTCSEQCLASWGEPLGAGLQKLARTEVGGSPTSARGAYAARSPLTHVRTIAHSCVPLQLWWSVADRVVANQQLHSRLLLRTIKRLNPRAPVEGYAGFWIHTRQMHANTHLPRALASFGLLSEPMGRKPPRLYVVPRPAASVPCLPGW
jgi:pimeloyl-ACP methyl ester carboxylesterase